MDNIILLTDSYKVSHWKQYPFGTEEVYSYFEARSNGEFSWTTFFGLHYIIKKYLEGPVVTHEKLEKAQKLLKEHFGQDLVNTAGWEHIISKHNGMLPISIKAVKEGMNIPTKNVLFTVENTDPAVPWLTSYLETLLVQCWYPMTVCTTSNRVRKVLDYAAEKSGTPELVPFKLHDFGFRGVSSVESAGIGGLAHLVNFKGTDTLEALEAAQLYGAGVCGHSIPAAEHSTITSWGQGVGERNAYANMLTQYPTGLVAVVSDSFNIYDACKYIWGTELRDRVMARDGCLVIRPDSGDIVTTVLKVLTILGERFGTYVNKKGYKVLVDKVRIIQGDGCNLDSIKQVVDAMLMARWSIDNIAFGMGGGLLQKCNRDTFGCAFKCSSITISGQDRDVYKQPIGDASKVSKRGRLALTNGSNNTIITVAEKDLGDRPNLLNEVFRDGFIFNRQSFEEIRANALESNVQPCPQNF